MKRYKRKQLEPMSAALDNGALDELFAKRKSVSFANVLDSKLHIFDKQYIIWELDHELWKRAYDTVSHSLNISTPSNFALFAEAVLND